MAGASRVSKKLFIAGNTKTAEILASDLHRGTPRQGGTGHANNLVGGQLCG
jgi:hypothetical protein